MKKLLSIFAACAVVIALAACQKDSEPVVEPTVVDEGLVGELTKVSFTVKASEQSETRSISDGLLAKNLRYAVYRAEDYVSASGNKFYKGQYIPSLSQGDDADAAFSNAKIEDKGNGNWLVTLTLAKNVKYDIVFWAHADNAPYTFDEPQAKIIVNDNYIGLANAENRDAFYGICRDYSVVDSDTKVELFRPFAQINFGASDYIPYITDLGLTMTSTFDTKYHEAVEAVYEHNDPVNGRLLYAAKPSVASCKVPTILYVLTGAVDGGAEVNFATAKIPYESGDKLLLSTGEGENKVDYHWMGMNYILAGDDRATIDNIHAVFSYAGENLVVDVPNVPYRRNYKTNILGNIFTGKARFNVVVMPEYIKDVYVRDLDEYSTLNAVEKALFDAVAADKLLAQTTLTADMPVTSTITVPEGMELVVDLGGKNIASTVSPAFIVNGSLKLTNGSASVAGEFIRAAAGAQVSLEGVSVVSGSETAAGDNCVFVPVDAKNVKVVVENGTVLTSYGAPAIQCNGNTKGFELVVKGKVVSAGVAGSAVAASHAMYLPQVASCTLESGAEVIGVTGVEIRGGNLLVMEGAKVTANGAFKAAANNNGTTVEGAAIAVSPHSTNLPINVTIKGGELSGAYAIYEVNFQPEGTRTAETTITIDDTKAVLNGPVSLL